MQRPLRWLRLVPDAYRPLLDERTPWGTAFPVLAVAVLMAADRHGVAVIQEPLRIVPAVSLFFLGWAGAWFLAAAALAVSGGVTPNVLVSLVRTLAHAHLPLLILAAAANLLAFSLDVSGVMILLTATLGLVAYPGAVIAACRLVEPGTRGMAAGVAAVVGWGVVVLPTGWVWFGHLLWR